MRLKKSPKTVWVLPLAALLVLAALPAQAQFVASGGDGEIATMSVHGGNVSFTPRISFEEMTLTVAGGGHFSSQSSRSGQTASFAPVDSKGYALPDGTYNWEIVVSPPARNLNTRAFRNGKVSADGRTVEAAQAPRGQRQSGAFTVKNGRIVDANLVEAQSGRGTRSAAPSASAPPSAAARAVEHNDRDN